MRRTRVVAVCGDGGFLFAVGDLATALRRVQDHALPLESARAQVAYGQPSAINRLLVLNAEPQSVRDGEQTAGSGRATVLLLREAIGF